MRDMSRLQAVDWSTYGLPEMPTIEDPERFFPDPVLVKPMKTERHDDGSCRVWRDDKHTWERVHPICIDIIEGLERGLSFDGLVRAMPHYPEQNIRNKPTIKRIVRKYAWKLHQLGHVRIDLEPAPTMFHGRFRRIKELGRGGLGIAHLCADEHDDDREVVVKHPWGVKARIQSGQKAIALELEVLGRAEHPSLPQIVDRFEVRGLLHMVRDFVDGERLSSAARARPDDRAWRVDKARQVADALHHIHDLGYLFFDPSPDNFFVREDGRVIVSDVGGVRRHMDGYVRTNGPRGTAGYVAPELRNADSVGERWASIASDVYSFGALYYALCVGRRPKRLWRHDEIMADVEERGLSTDDAAVIDVCTREEPADRPRSLLDAAGLLES